MNQLTTTILVDCRNGGHATSPLMVRLCGRENEASEFVSHSNALHLRFHSDASNSRDGFQLFYDTATTGTSCNVTAAAAGTSSCNVTAAAAGTSCNVTATAAGTSLSYVTATSADTSSCNVTATAVGTTSCNVTAAGTCTSSSYVSHK